MSTVETIPLTRAALASRSGSEDTTPPIRIVHLGLGAFARAHQAAYTAEVDTAGEWGIAAFTGRSATVAEQLRPQDGLFTLIERSADDDSARIVSSIVEVNDGSDLRRLVELLAAPETVIVTITITEAGYRLRGDGEPDLDDEVVTADLALLVEAAAEGTAAADGAASPALQSALARLVWGLAARRAADAGALAIVPCDNMPENGAFVRRGVIALASRVDRDLAHWIAEHVSFVSTSVDRITPRITDDDITACAALTGFADASPVVTEPFRDWVLSGKFPGGRPRWEHAGARFVDDIEPFERRKLWLLNGAHSLLAYAGLLRGHRTVATAIADDASRAEVRALWAEAARHLPACLDVDAYCAALIERFENARIAHHLTQIAAEGLTKLRVRIVPIARAERAEGRGADGAAAAVGAWIAVVLRGDELIDAHRGAVLAAREEADPVQALLTLIDRDLAADAPFAASVRERVNALLDATLA